MKFAGFEVQVDDRLGRDMLLVVGGAVAAAGVIWTAIALHDAGEVFIGKARWDAEKGDWIVSWVGR